ncbi:MAG: tetratricopeptide repeat protein [Acidithiobacillus sp.]|uniref:tetratricopeptide repeat protein n=1 Tax=Acidithiobacillus sp. TaxID=1872118 RepID=UPI0025C4434B|nr:sel1 repeat family protein [Acidithiobacillus sp.]
MDWDEKHLDLLELAGLRDDLEALRQRALAGDPVAQFNMGVRYAEGRGVAPDLLEAAKWYSAAADQGDAQAQFNLGLLFYQGQGLPRNLVYAYELFRAAAAQGDARAAAGLAALDRELSAEDRSVLGLDASGQQPQPTRH